MAINLGNIVGNTVGGIASGLDSAAIIKGLSAARQTQIDKLGDSVSLNNSKISSYSDLKTILSNMQTAANFLRNPPGVLGGSSNVFNYRTATLSSTLTTSNFLSVTAGAGAAIGKYNIQIGAIAQSLQQRSGSFNSSSTSATVPSSGSYFTAGTFQVGSGVVKPITSTSKTGDVLAANEYTVAGTGAGAVTAAGIHNITVTGASGGHSSLSGKVSGFSASYNNGDNTLTLKTTINGIEYTSNPVPADSVIGSDTGIAAGTNITFTTDKAGPKETSFDITIANDVVINADPTATTSFVNSLTTGLSNQTIYQSRELQNFSVAAGALTGLTSANVKFTSDTFGNAAIIGDISGFKVQKSTGSDGAVSVTIGNETFRAVGLGTSVTGTLTLQSTTTGKKLDIDLAAAGITVDLSTDAAAQNFERSLDYVTGNRAYSSITVDAGDSLADIAYSINAQTSITGLTASIVKVNDFDYRLSLKSNNVGIDNEYDLVDPSGVFANTGLTTTQAASDAVIRVDGVEVTRSTNNISDVISNVTINVLAATPNYGTASAASADLNVGNDVSSVVTAVQSFLNNYYEFREFLAKQTERDPQTSALIASATLGNETTLATLADQLSNLVVKGVSNTGNTNFTGLTNLGVSLADLTTTVTETVDGKTTTRSVPVTNALTFDEEKLRNFLTNNFDSVRKIFEFDFTSSSDKISVFARTNATTLNNFKLDINTSRPAGQQVQILNADGTPYLEKGQPVYAAYSAGKITGTTGTALEGLELIYTGSGTETVSISMSQGIADMVYNLANIYTKDSGSIDTAVKTVKTATENTTKDSEKLKTDLQAFVSRMQSQFNALEQAIARVNNILDYLTASDNARNKG